MDFDYIAKIVFIAFVIVLFMFVVVSNNDDKNIKHSSLETFSNDPTTTTIKQQIEPKPKPKPLQERIKATYMDLFTMPPNKEEVDFYVRFFKNKTTPSDKYLQEVISISAPTLKRTLQVAQPITKKDLANGTEDEVLVIFNEILNRNPTPEELEFYAKMIKKSPSQVEKLKVLLLQSQEYRMLQKMQTNKTNALTLRGVTDRQVVLTVSNIYKSIAKVDDIDEETLAFLKKKYIEFNMDDEMFKKFVKSMVAFKASSPTSASKTSTDTKFYHRQRANADITKHLEDKCKSGSGVNTSDMICEIQQKAKRQFPRNSETALSDEIHNRNREELRQICARNKLYSNFTDNDMVLLKDQSWTVPQKHPPVCVGGDAKFNPLMTQTSLIGTLLGDIPK